jgi:hypothetical protein
MKFRSICLLLALAGSAGAQWLDHKIPGTPRTKDGKPNLSAPAPRASSGKPDLSGIWQADPAPPAVLQKMLEGGVNGLGEDPPALYFLNILADFKPQEAPMLPHAAAAFQKNTATYGANFQTTRCLPAGVVAGDLLPIPYKLVQTPGLILMLYEADNTFRQIFTDGRAHPADPQPSWLGYSVGKWEGDTLVVDTIGFNGSGWLDAIGHIYSDALHVVERFRRRDFGHLEVQIAIEDPKTFTKPFSVKFTQTLRPDTDLIESFCAENEKDIEHLK